MKAIAIKTSKILPGETDLFGLLDKSLPSLSEGDVVVVTSKIISLCESNVIPLGSIDKEVLLIRESDQYLPGTISKYGHHFTITNNTLIPMAGIDESNGGDNYVLWPKDAQKSANEIRNYLAEKFDLKKIGVIITDSTCQPLRRGTTGIAIAHSGFLGLKDYVGTPDLFGRPFNVTQASIAGGLAAAAVLIMGEGTEQTPLCVLSDLPFVVFQDSSPSKAELAEIYINLEDDLFAPFLKSVKWQKGGRKTKNG